MTLALKPPHNELLELKTTTATLFTSRSAEKTVLASASLARNVLRICSSIFSYGSMFSIITCAWCSLELATIFIALVILRVLLTEAIRFFISLSDGILL